MCEHRLIRLWAERDGWVWSCVACGQEGWWPDPTEAEGERGESSHGVD